MTDHQSSDAPCKIAGNHLGHNPATRGMGCAGCDALHRIVSPEATPHAFRGVFTCEHCNAPKAHPLHGTRSNDAPAEWVGRDPRDVARAKELGKTFGLNAVKVGVLVEHFDEVRRQAEARTDYAKTVRNAALNEAEKVCRDLAEEYRNQPSRHPGNACNTCADLIADLRIANALPNSA